MLKLLMVTSPKYEIISLLLFYWNKLVNRAYRAWIKLKYVKKELYIPMRDGKKLFTTIYLPRDKSGTHPLLIQRTPYSCRPYGNKSWKPFWIWHYREYFLEGYIMVVQDVRGRWMSEGEFVDVRPFRPDKKTADDIDETSDAFDTVEWLLNNIKNHNGRVGFYGESYDGFYTVMAAASGHPAVYAVSPQAPMLNTFIGDDWHHNGAFFLLDTFSFYTQMGLGFGTPRPAPVNTPPDKLGYPLSDNYKFFLEAGTLREISGLAGDHIAFWKDLMAHPDYDEWWKERDARIVLKDLKPAVLWVGGMFDAENRWGSWNGYKALKNNNPGKEFNKIVMGPWSHKQWSQSEGTHLGKINFGSKTSIWYQKYIEIPFFNYFLKRKGEKPNIPEASIFTTGSNVWRHFDSWPPTNTLDKSLYFSDGDKLLMDKPDTEESFSEYLSDPAKPVPYTERTHIQRSSTYVIDDQRFTERRPDVLVFKTDCLPQDLTVTGPVGISFFVSIDSTDADFVVKLIDVFPDGPVSILQKNTINPSLPPGYEMLVLGEVMRGKYRNSFEKPEPFVPGQIDKLNFILGDVAHTFLKDHRIMVQVQSSWFPLVDRNPQKFVNIYQAGRDDFRKAFIRIYHDQNRTSKLILPVLQ